MATSPQFVATSIIGHARPNAASITPDGSGGTLFDLVTGAANGTRVDSIRIINSQATYTASLAIVARIYITDTSGLNPRLFDEVAIPASVIRSATAASTANVLLTYPGGIFIASGQKIRVAVSSYTAADQVDFTARGGNL